MVIGVGDVDAAVLGGSGKHVGGGGDRLRGIADGAVGLQVGRPGGDVGLRRVGRGDAAVLALDDRAALVDVVLVAGGDLAKGDTAIDVGDQHVAVLRLGIQYVGVDLQRDAFGTDGGAIVGHFQVQGTGAGAAAVGSADAVAGGQVDGTGGGLDLAGLLDLGGVDGQRGRLDHAGVVHHRGHQVLGGVALQQDVLRLDLAAVVDADLGIAGGRAQLIGGHVEVDQAAALQVDVEAVAGGHGDAADVGDDHAGVVDLRRDEIDEAAVADLDLALVADRGQFLALHLAERQAVAAHEAGGIDVQGGGQQAGDVDLGVGAEDDAVGVDQEDVAVGFQRALDVGELVAEHPVQGDRVVTRGLDELHQLVGGNVEFLPVDDGLLGRLVDDGLQRRALVDGRGAAGDHTAGGAGQRRLGDGSQGNGNSGDCAPYRRILLFLAGHDGNSFASREPSDQKW
ncbi:hypothetical protein D9M70_252800 [compost metagenome]